MNQSALIIGIVAIVVILLAIFGIRLYLRIKRSSAAFPVRINYVRRDQSLQGPFLLYPPYDRCIPVYFDFDSSGFNQLQIGKDIRIGHGVKKSF